MGRARKDAVLPPASLSPALRCSQLQVPATGLKSGHSVLAWELSLQQGSWSSWLCPGLFLTTCRASIFLMLWPQRGSTEGMLGRVALLVGLLKAQCLLSCYAEVENGHPGVSQWKERDRGCSLPSLIPMGLAMGRFQSPPGVAKLEAQRS